MYKTTQKEKLLISDTYFESVILQSLYLRKYNDWFLIVNIWKQPNYGNIHPQSITFVV